MLPSVQMNEMNDIQERISELIEKGWSKASIADEMGVAHVTVEKWYYGERYPRPVKPIADALDQLLKRKRIPKKRRYKLKVVASE